MSVDRFRRTAVVAGIVAMTTVIPQSLAQTDAAAPAPPPATGASGARKLPPELQSDVDSYRRAGLRMPKTPVRFENYRVIKHRAGFDLAGEMAADLALAFKGGSQERDRKYSFVQTEGEREVWSCSCSVTWTARRNVQEDTGVKCLIWRPGDPATWKLEFGPALDPKIKTESGYSGSLQSERATYEVRAFAKVSSSFLLTGKGVHTYVFLNSGQGVAAVDDAPRGHLTFRKSVPPEERQLLAAAASALLLQWAQ